MFIWLTKWYMPQRVSWEETLVLVVVGKSTDLWSEGYLSRTYNDPIFVALFIVPTVAFSAKIAT